MRPRFSWTLLLLPALCASNAFAAGVTTLESKDASVLNTGADVECPALTERFTRQLLHPSVPILGKVSYLVTQEFVVPQGCDDAHKATVTVYARPFDVKTGKVESTKAWSFSTDGFGYWGEAVAWRYPALYAVTVPGCCTTVDTFKYFSLNTGKLVASTTMPLLEIVRSADGTDFKKQYIGVESGFASSPQAPREARATIFVGDTDGVVETIALPASDKPDGVWEVDTFELLSGKSPNPTTIDVDPSARPVVHLVASCDCTPAEIDVLVPIGPTGFDLAAAKITGPSVGLTRGALK